MDVPEYFEALGSRLTVRIRLSPHTLRLLNTSEIPMDGINAHEMYLQLGIYQRNGEMVMLTQEKIKRIISANWQEVSLTIIIKPSCLIPFFSFACLFSKELEENVLQ